MNRKENSHYSKIIHEKNVLVIFSWLNYTPANYRADFKEYKDYLEKYYTLHPEAFTGLKTSSSSFPEDTQFLDTLKKEIEFDLAKHPVDLMNKELMSFDESRKAIENKVSQIIFNLFEQDPALMLPDNRFAVKITVESVKDREWYFEHFFDKAKSLMHMDKERMLYKISGYWLMHNILIPSCHLPDDPSHVENATVWLLQQLKQHQDVLEKNLIDDTKLNSELKKYVSTSDSRNVKYLYFTLHGVWSSVLSEFYATYGVKKFITIPAGSIHAYRRLLNLLTVQSQNKVTAFYEQYIGYQNTGFSSEYSMGRIIGALAVAALSEESKKPYDIFIDGNIIKTKNLRERGTIINDAILKGTTIQLGNFNQAEVNRALREIRSKSNLIEFLDYVERIFKIFCLASQNQIFNKEIFNELVQKANSRK